MNKIISIPILLIVFQSLLFSHTLLLNVFDNEDNTIQVEGIFSTGEPAVGAQILLKSLANDQSLYKQRLPSEGELKIIIPKEPYQVILNGGPGHYIIKEGIPPLESFKKEKLLANVNLPLTKNVIVKNNSRNNIIFYGLIGAFLLLFITIYISIKNTNKLVKILRDNK